MTHVTALLIQATHVLPDTLVTKQVPAAVGTFEKITSIASGLATVALLILAIGLVPAAWNFRKTYKKINELLDRVYGDIAPLVRSASIVTEDAREIVTIVKGDVRQVQQTIAAANARLLKAVKEAEARLDEFNALIEVVQEEAESAFVNTASAVHGVRTGLAQVFDNTEEFEDGDDRYGSDTSSAQSAQSAEPAGPPRPRTAPRRRGGLV
ncbi:MAG: DUF948 domain-containing protein [Gemmatimonadaceae bacterium]